MTLKCHIQSNKLKKSESKIRYKDSDDWDQNLSQLLSTILKKFKFLSDLNESEWAIRINSQIIDKQDGQTFGSILSSIPSNKSNPVCIEIVNTTSSSDEKNEFEQDAKYIVTVHHNDQQRKYPLNEDSEEWNDETFETLKSKIATRFDIDGSFEILTKDSGVDIDDYDCLKDEFDSLDNGNTVHVVLQVMMKKQLKC